MELTASSSPRSMFAGDKFNIPPSLKFEIYIFFGPVKAATSDTILISIILSGRFSTFIPVPNWSKTTSLLLSRTSRSFFSFMASFVGFQRENFP